MKPDQLLIDWLNSLKDDCNGDLTICNIKKGIDEEYLNDECFTSENPKIPDRGF